MSKITLIGIDTAKSVFHVVGIDRNGKFDLRRKVRRAKLLATVARLEPCRVVLEACAASHHWARQIEALGHEVKLVAAKHVKPYRRGQKNDYRDAEAIIAAALSPGMHFVGVKSEGQQAEQALHRVRSRWQSQRNGAANALRALLAEYGVVCALGHTALRAAARAFIDRGDAARLNLQELIEDVLEEMGQLDERVVRYERRIEQRVRADEISRRLSKELHGVGPLGASALRVKVADARDFGNGRNFAAYLGMAPGHRGTGGQNKVGKLSRQHDRYVRQLLIHGARSALRHLGDKQDPQSCWLRALKERRGFDRASVALAHKNARQAWAILAQPPAS